jgi:tetratricopeptide (TPR) repeat protein
MYVLEEDIRAYTLYNQAVNLNNHPDNPGALKQAIEVYKEALNLKQDLGEALINLGTLYDKLGQVDAAVKCFDDILSFKGASPNIQAGAYYREWNTGGNEGKMKEFLKSQNATVTRVPYKFNRCVLFNSILLHETDSHRFGLSEEMEEKGEEGGTEQQRINFTILFGTTPAANDKGNRKGGMRVF